MAIKFNIGVSKPIAKPITEPVKKIIIEPVKKVISSNSNRTELFNILRNKGFQFKEIEDTTILRLVNSNAFYVKLYSNKMSVVLWCTEDNYTYKEKRLKKIR